MNWSPWLQFLLLVLAVGHIIDVWFNGQIFSTARALLQPRAYLFTCAYCLTVWVTAALMACAIFLPNNLGWYGIMTVAAMRGSWLFNTFLPEELQYQPKTENQDFSNDDTIIESGDGRAERRVE